MTKFNSSKSVLLRSGLTLVELLVVISIIGILLGMLMPATRGVRSGARRTHCANNIRQIALACLNYESSYLEFPSPMGQEDIVRPEGDNQKISGLVVLLPYLEHSPFFHEISNPLVHDEIQYPAFPSPDEIDYPNWQVHVDAYLCSAGSYDDDGFGETSYAFSIGDAAFNIHKPKYARGASAATLNMSLADIKDGTSNTILLAEIRETPSNHMNGRVAIYQSSDYLKEPELAIKMMNNNGSKFPDSMLLSELPRGGNWADGSAAVAMVNTILPPGSPNLSVGDELSDGLYSAGSYHSGGVNMARADGSVSFIANDIDCGDLKQKPMDLADANSVHSASHYGVWGQLGSAAGEELTGE